MFFYNYSLFCSVDFKHYISWDIYHQPRVYFQRLSEARWLMVSAFHSCSGGPGSSPGRVLGQDTFTVPHFTQVYKWVPADLRLRVTFRSTRIPSGGGRGGVEVILVDSCYRYRDKFRSNGPLGSYVVFLQVIILI